VLFPYRIPLYENRIFPYILRPTGYGTTPGCVTRHIDDDVSVAEERENDQSKTEVTMQWKLLLMA